VPGVTGDTGASVVGGKVREPLGLRLGTIGAGIGGGICAPVPVAQRRMAANATGTTCFIRMTMPTVPSKSDARSPNADPIAGVPRDTAKLPVRWI